MSLVAGIGRIVLAGVLVMTAASLTAADEEAKESKDTPEASVEQDEKETEKKSPDEEAADEFKKIYVSYLGLEDLDSGKVETFVYSFFHKTEKGRAKAGEMLKTQGRKAGEYAARIAKEENLSRKDAMKKALKDVFLPFALEFAKEHVKYEIFKTTKSATATHYAVLFDTRPENMRWREDKETKKSYRVYLTVIYLFKDKKWEESSRSYDTYQEALHKAAETY